MTEKELNKLYRYALALTGHDDQAYDLVHDAIIKVQGRFSFNKEAYTKTTIRNMFFDKRRKEKKYEDLNEDLLPTNSFESEVISKDEVQKYLEILEPEQRELLYLVIVEDYSYKEVAKFTGLKIGTVMSRLSRCKKKIKEAKDE